MKIVYKVFHLIRVICGKILSAYKDYCCRRNKNKITQINMKGNNIMLIERQPISLAKTEMQAKAIGYTHEEWIQYLESLKEDEDTSNELETVEENSSEEVEETDGGEEIV